MRNEACSTVELRRAGDIAQDLSDRLKGIFKMTEDPRMLRAELILEEAAEVLHALSARDENLLFDGLVDLLYVTLGTAVTYDLPMSPGFQAVHRSNMTKGQSAGSHSGDKGKGDGFIPVDIESVIQRYRKGA